MSRHRKAYVISYYGALCHDMSYVMTIVASLHHGSRPQVTSCIKHITYQLLLTLLEEMAKLAEPEPVD